MIDSVHYENGQQQVHIDEPNSSSSSEEPQGLGNILCSHDGVLLRKASAEHIADLNTSGSLSVVEYPSPRRRLYVEWRPNEIIPIAKDNLDQGDWSLVDTITKRTRTTSECNAFNIKPPETSPNSTKNKPRIRTHLDELASIEIRHRCQVMRFISKLDGSVHSEFLFQYGNADIFINSMRHLHLIDYTATNRNGDDYVILSTETQKLKKTFAELDIGEIKASSVANESWLSNKVVGFLVNIPEYMTTQRAGQKSRPGAMYDENEAQKSPVDNYQVIGLNGSYSASIGASQSNESSLEKSSPVDSGKENVKEEDEKLVNNKLPERKTVIRGAPLNEAQWLEFKTPDGRISDATRIKELIFRGGINHNLRARIWKYLLNYYLWHESTAEQQKRCEQKYEEYYRMKLQWRSMTATQEANFSGYRERKCQIEKDVKRTDRCEEFFAGEDNPNLQMLQRILMTYVMYNFDLGYVQGMSDLLAPILVILVTDEHDGKDMREKEADAFWCFVGFMDMVFANFDIDQMGMKQQFNQLRRLLEFANPRLFNYMVIHDSDNMYFCFRWLLVWYKREFATEDVLKLWECLWTRLPCLNFHLLISVAILDQQTEVIIESKYEFTEILKHINELSGNIDLKQTLATAEAIYLQIKAADDLPNDIREIIGEPLLDIVDDDANDEQELDDDFDHVEQQQQQNVERMRQEEQLEEALQISMLLNT